MNPSNLNFISHVGLNVCCHNRFLSQLLWRELEITPYITHSCSNISSNVLLAELKQQGGLCGSIQAAFLLSRNKTSVKIQTWHDLMLF